MENMTSKELKELAKELKVKNWWSLSKAALIEEIEKIQNATDEDKAAREEELRKRDELFEHYSKNWTKYGPKNDWVKFLRDYEAGKITLIEEEKKQPETDSSASEESIEEIVGQDSLEEQERDEKQIKPSKKKAEPKEKKSRGKMIDWNGKSQNLDAWARELGMTRQTLYARLYIQNWDVEKAFTTPGRKAKGEA